MKKHFYIFTFQSPLGGGGFSFMESTGCFEQRHITLSGIKSAKAGANVSPEAVIINISYLGHMTKDEFTDAE